MFISGLVVKMQRLSDDTPREEQIARLLSTATQIGLNNVVEDHALREVINSYFLDDAEDDDAQEAELGPDLDLSSESEDEETSPIPTQTDLQPVSYI